MCNKKLRRYEDALEAFNKLHNILRNSAQVMYQLADLYPFSTDTDRQTDRITETRSTVGHFTVWISLSLRLSPSHKFGLRPKISQKVKSLLRLG